LEPLGRVIDPEELDRSSGDRARLELEVPEAWLEQGAEIELRAPERLTCARCEGGGCDACGRSGALRAPADEVTRTLRLTVPAGSDTGVALRLLHPFGDAGARPIEQLIVEVRPGARASLSAVRLEAPLALPRDPPRPQFAFAPLVLFAAALAAAIVAAALQR
jgi:hypothetical protein